MELSAAILGIAVALTLGAMSPGPSFIMVARTSVAVSRRDGLAAAVGMGVGSVLFSAIALLGVISILTAIPLLHLGLKVLGGTCLIYLGYRIWRGARQPLVLENTPLQDRRTQPWRSFVLGLATQVSNPKTAVVYASIFASLLPSKVPPFVLVALPIMIFAIETIWYSMVALVLSAPSPRAHYLASKAWLDRAAGAIMSLLGLKLIFETQQP
ncbi:MAG: LysE family translocator [Rhodocyclaceae bacterium]|jgi:threonine/homoserine/homoserine lactone efflux protein|nr:LysE family translocator [Rhodocyclaceae bacterium]MCA3057850.1 LysE family translocator [Rhodocyclaceae bacterium]